MSHHTSHTLRQQTFAAYAPYTNINGTSKEGLINQKRELYELLGNTLNHMENNSPHSRDYLQGGGKIEDWRAVVKEDRRRLQVITDLRAVLLDEMIAIDEGRRGLLYQPLTDNASKLAGLKSELM